jgi:hypothetical protein
VFASLLTAALLAAPPVISIDYPEDGSIFPPEITAPTFLWRDRSPGVNRWTVEVSFEGGAPPLRAATTGPRLRLGRIDPTCVSPTNQPPVPAPGHSWKPAAEAWERIKRLSVDAPATVAIRGYRTGDTRAVSSGQIRIQTSRDPAGAPIFYRDVPLMPTPSTKGQIRPLAPQALPLVEWRLRDIGAVESRVVMEDLPVCANCHSFSRDGRTLGMDLDGLRNNKGQYFLAEVAPRTEVRREDLVQWSSAQGKLPGAIRVGFMSQVSPDGQFVATTLNPDTAPDAPSNYYVTNYPDYKFLQVFYPTRGLIAWYNRATGALQPLPGADDPRYVQMGAVWSPAGDWLVFARAEAGDPYPPGAPEAKFANDPNERPMRYDLYRIPFNGGRGGVAEPIAGASANGMSNTFPKVSPDGRWIVSVQSRNGMLLRPDSQLYIVLAAGGVARRMRANTARMNSWHSFSPNGRWLVFSSKARSPYTQMYLTHIDADGNDSPAILIDNATAANRAVNLPEFVNIAPDRLRELGGPAIDYYKRFNRALYLQKQNRLTEAIAAWRGVLELNPDDELAERNLALTLLLAGRRGEAGEELRKMRK